MGIARLEEAIEAFKKAVSIKPDFADGYLTYKIIDRGLHKSTLTQHAEAYNHMGIAFKKF